MRFDGALSARALNDTSPAWAVHVDAAATTAECAL